MTDRRRLANWAGAILGSLCALLLVSTHAIADDDHGRLTEEFHQTYALAAEGRIELENINGPVHITAWDRNEVKVDAVKYAKTQERLAEAKILIEAGPNSISIRTKYPERNQSFHNDDWNNPASVEYTLMVPRSARLDEIKLINGPLDLNGTADVHAQCINGRLTAKGLTGRVQLSTINGTLRAEVVEARRERIELSSVNGTVELMLPSDIKADLEASTVHGPIENDFGLHTSGRFVGRNLRGELGGGGVHIEVKNVNGRISVRHANDGRALSPAKDRNHDDHDTI